MQKDEKMNNNEAVGLWNDSEQVLYNEPSKKRPKMMRFNSWIKLNKAKTQKLRLESIYWKMQLRVKCELGGRIQKHPKTVYSNYRVRYIHKNCYNYKKIEQVDNDKNEGTAGMIFRDSARDWDTQ